MTGLLFKFLIMQLLIEKLILFFVWKPVWPTTILEFSFHVLNEIKCVWGFHLTRCKIYISLTNITGSELQKALINYSDIGEEVLCSRSAMNTENFWLIKI